MTAKILEFPDPFEYIMYNDSVTGIAWCGAGVRVEFFRDGTVSATNGAVYEMPKNALKELMVMWLALEYPELVEIEEGENNENKL